MFDGLLKILVLLFESVFFKDLLIFHGVGSGKTVSAINIYNVLFNYSPKWNVFLLIPASLRDDPWLKDLKEWLTVKDREIMFKNIQFVHLKYIP